MRDLIHSLSPNPKVRPLRGMPRQLLQPLGQLVHHIPRASTMFPSINHRNGRMLPMGNPWKLRLPLSYTRSHRAYITFRLPTVVHYSTLFALSMISCSSVFRCCTIDVLHAFERRQISPSQWLPGPWIQPLRILSYRISNVAYYQGPTQICNHRLLVPVSKQRLGAIRKDRGYSGIGSETNGNHSCSRVLKSGRR